MSVSVREIELLKRCILAEHQARSDRRRADRLQKLVDRYWDIRGWLRACDDTPGGYAEFYRECCLLIFGEYRGEQDDDE